MKGKEIVVTSEADDSSCQCSSNSVKADNGTCVLKSNGNPKTLTCETPKFIQKGNTCKCNVEGGYNKDLLNETTVNNEALNWIKVKRQWLQGKDTGTGVSQHNFTVIVFKTQPANQEWLIVLK